MAFDPRKPVQTRDGNKARILSTGLNGCGGTSICAVVTIPTGNDTCAMFWADGSYLRNAEHDWDLVNIPEEKTSRMKLYPPIKNVASVWVKVTIRDNNVVKVELD